MTWLAFAFTYLAVLAFALAMKPHHVAVFRAPPSEVRQRTFRFTGIALAAAALACLRAPLGWQIGLVTWIAMHAVSGFILSQIFAFYPRGPLPATPDYAARERERISAPSATRSTICNLPTPIVDCGDTSPP